jgi:hypothetical protein
MNKPLRVTLWEILLGLLLAAGVLGAAWMFVTECPMEIVP